MSTTFQPGDRVRYVGTGETGVVHCLPVATRPDLVCVKMDCPDTVLNWQQLFLAGRLILLAPAEADTPHVVVSQPGA